MDLVSIGLAGNGFIDALSHPVCGTLIAEYLYAGESVFTYNLCWELREHFLGEIFDIRGGQNAWRSLQDICSLLRCCSCQDVS